MTLGFKVQKIRPKLKDSLKKSAKKNADLVMASRPKKDVKLKDDDRIFRKFPPILFPYQQEFIKAAKDPRWKCLVFEKSRRIGATHGLAAYAVLEAAKHGGSNFFYIGLNLSMAREFISSAAYWAKHFNFASSYMEEQLIQDEREDIQVLKVTFKSGKKIEALSSKPSAIRGRAGNICIDEAAFLEDDLDEFLKATLSLTIWGNKVFVISTHNGVDNKFNKLCQSIDKGENPYYKQRTTLREAVDQGLYQRICLMSRKDWAPEDERIWMDDIYKQYGDAAVEELDAIPRVSNPNAIFKPEQFQKICKEDIPKGFDIKMRFWDMAATSKDTSCYSVGTLLGVKGDKKYILDVKYCRLNPGESEDFFMQVTKNDGKSVAVGVELEGGSMALRYADYVKKSLTGFTVKFVKPEGSKLLRALPVKEALKRGEYYIADSDWTDDYIKHICQFDGSRIPLVTDMADSLSGAQENTTRKINHLLSS